VNDVAQTIIMLKNPFEGLRNLVEKKRRGPEAEWEVKVNINNAISNIFPGGSNHPGV